MHMVLQCTFDIFPSGGGGRSLRNDIGYAYLVLFAYDYGVLI